MSNNPRISKVKVRSSSSTQGIPSNTTSDVSLFTDLESPTFNYDTELEITIPGSANLILTGSPAFTTVEGEIVVTYMGVDSSSLGAMVPQLTKVLLTDSTGTTTQEKIPVIFESV